MTAELERRPDLPLWLQLKSVLRGSIERGEFVPDGRLPSESELCSQFGVSRTVVRGALQDLVVDGLVQKIKGKGAFVSPRDAAADFLARTLSFTREMTEQGRHVTSSVRAHELLPATSREAAALRLEAGAHVVRTRRVISVDTQPRWLVTSALVATLVPGLERAQLENRSLHGLLRRRYGLVFVRGERWVDAVLPSQAEAVDLGISAGTPVLAIESIARLQDGTSVEYSFGLYLSRGARLHVATSTS